MESGIDYISDILYGDDSVNEQMKKELEAAEERFQKIVAFSPEMDAYRTEIQNVITALKSIDALDLIFDTAVLIAIDDGWGYDEVVAIIAQELQKAFHVESSRIHVKDEKYPTDKKAESWKSQYEKMDYYSSLAKSGTDIYIYRYDLSDATSEVFTFQFKKNMLELRRNANKIFLVFHIPFMARKMLYECYRALSDVMSTRLVAVAPISVEKMAIYLREQLKKKIKHVDGVCDDLLKQWIFQEMSKGIFYGYDSLEKMATELIYHKALDAKCEMQSVTMKDVQKLLNDSVYAENAYDLLNELIGMAKIKKTVKEIVAQIKLQKEFERQGKNIERPSMHMLFLGNPGTGKTTLARIIGKIFKQEGLLRKGNFLQINASDLVVSSIGTTIEKLRTVCRDSYGSVLFIDEAYGFNIGHSNGKVTDEILPTLVAELENHRDDMCVILAGYQDKMEDFLKENTGLRSRIPYILEFPNYTKKELMEIFFHMVNGTFEYEEELKELVCAYIQNIPEEALKTKEFSNARFIRNLYERLWGKAAYRISLSGEKDILLKKEDMMCVMEEEDFQDMMLEKNKKPIGFLARQRQ